MSNVTEFTSQKDLRFLREVFQKLNKAKDDAALLSNGNLTRLYKILNIEPPKYLEEEPDCVSFGVTGKRLETLRTYIASKLRVPA